VTSPPLGSINNAKKCNVELDDYEWYVKRERDEAVMNHLKMPARPSPDRVENNHKNNLRTEIPSDENKLPWS